MSQVRTVESYREELRLINEAGRRSWGAAVQAGEYRSALKGIRLMQKKLRQVKREINQDMKVLRQHYRSETQKARKVAGFLGRLLGGYRDSRARAGRRGRAAMESHIRPYEQLKLAIDQALVDLDEIKLKLESELS